MTDRNEKPAGLTKDVGWEVGARRTYATYPGEAWELLLSEVGVQLWLGDVKGEHFDFAKGAKYELKDGTIGEVRVFEPNSHVRLTYHPAGRERASTIQVRVMDAKGDARTTIAFHEEHLPDEQAREQRKAHFTMVLDKLDDAIESRSKRKK
jgi:uncharacterized protein YndB with AHSA1/START domain